MYIIWVTVLFFQTDNSNNSSKQESQKIVIIEKFKFLKNKNNQTKKEKSVNQ